MSISDGTYTTSYAYDSANQLIRENNQQLGFTQTWEYDNGGNITFRRKYAYTTGSLENLVPVEVHEMSGHGMHGLGDLFAEYDGQVMSYDAIGNPLYDGQWTYTWEHGRELKTMSRGATTWTYTYDANGMRTQRTDGYYTYSYIYNGSQLSQLTVVYDDGEHYEYYELFFTYSADGTPLTVTYNDCTYHYVTNIQGDVIAILDDIGRLVCRYAYDAWGNVTDLGGRGDNVSYFNPLRYRGYVYDNETNLYYLQSRYYNPEWCRFLNADSIVSGVGGDVLGYNMFAYCFNNPVNMDDQAGNWPKWAKNAVKWVAKNIVKPVVKTVEKTLSKVDLTYSTGVNLSGTPSAWIFNGQIGVSMDTKGNVAIQASGGGGVTGGTPSISISGYRSITNAPSINELNGTGYQIGGSAIIPVEGVSIAVGGDFNIIPDMERDKTYYGGTLTGGLAVGKPGGEFHVEWGTTVTLPKTQFNIYDVAKSVYIKIMEW